MKAEEQYSSRERREREALEESDMIPRITIAENTTNGWQWSMTSLLKFLGIGLAALGLLWATLVSAQVPTPTPAPQDSRVCKPLLIDGIQCGKLCRWPDRWVIRGCKPLNKLMQP